MNWEAIGAAVDLIGGLAVVVTLIYFSVQLRQNNRQLEATRQIAKGQLWSDGVQITQNSMLAVAGPGLSRAWVRIQMNAEDLTDEEISAFDLFLTQEWAAVARARRLTEYGVMERDDWVEWMATKWMHFYLGNQTGLRYWYSHGQLLASMAPELVDAVNSRLASAGPEQPFLNSRRLEQLRSGKLPETFMYDTPMMENV